ncbi:zonular occludens toxin domain-containing protein [Methylomonas sp. UP202]|uniref:zonular occludens toxin domain-containing protein n=1 Tax=Methylomonas sp. UP202 TaxID=3040943 RepID=UPI00247A7D38|nr:zonular occludens toxin domain-containing protein [Methylomonas sp. UP202]WGS84971.1 zonular occludens toxin domain-containing protein [Methylomonas sp. UP202]
MAGITGLSGLPRSGKSYTAIELFVLPALREGRRIVTNLPLRMDAIRRDFPGADVEIIADLTIHDWGEVGGGCLAILDEVWRLWPQGQKMNAIPEKQLAFLKEHGHRSDENGRSMDVVLVTQDMQDICAPVRALVETTIICVKHLDLGREDAFVRYRCRAACSLVKKDNAPPQSQIIGNENARYDKSVYQYYRTHMHSAGDSAPNEKRMVGTSVFGSWKFRAGVVVFFLCIGIVVMAGRATVKGITEPTPVSVQTETVTTDADGKVIENPGPQTVEQAKPKATQVPYSEGWHIAGYISNPANPAKPPQYILVHQSKAQRLYPAAKCRMMDLEPACDVDGEVVTRWTGRQSPGYVEQTEKESG